ncbi:MAG: hypothetical protein BWK75_02575 [Candidatus Altiarchaeales archaeon A3]|nr:MAG: hypothetical protein BWK75_02575 [Candidatus Altiarchaeales archaeon A3]
MIRQISIKKDAFIGLFGLLTDKYCLLSYDFPNVELDVPVLRTKIYSTDLLGIFCVGNSNGLLVSGVVESDEEKKINDFCKKNDIRFGKILTDFNALGNLITCNDKHALISEAIPKKNLTDIKEILGVECSFGSVAEHTEIGSCLIVTNKGFLVHPDAENNLEGIKEIFGVNGRVGSVNLGFPYVKAGILANSRNAYVGDETTGIEMNVISDALKVD